MIKSIHPIAPLTILAATMVLATPAFAQQLRPGEQLGMRYLSWAGKPAQTTTDGLRRASDLAPHVQTASLVVPVVAPVPTPAPTRPNRYGAVSSSNSLTPASAWIGAPVARAVQQPAPQPYQPSGTAADAQTATAPQYDPSPNIRRQDAYHGAPPEVQAAMQPTPHPVQMPPPVLVPPATEAPADPIAPRRDALIFRMGGAAQPAQQQASQPASDAPRQLAQAAPTRSGAPARDGARYYSVHREAGHQPDPMVLPESIFIGGGAADLAEPPPAPIVPRTVNGRAQAVVPNQDPTLP